MGNAVRDDIRELVRKVYGDKKIIPRKLKPIESCPNGHYYNSSRTGEFCEVCGERLDPPALDELTPQDYSELVRVDKEDWACGWLLCIKGDNKGRDYKIFNRRNFVGFSSKMDIQIYGDANIAYDNHAQIIYDETNAKTVLVPGNSRSLIYVQGEAVFGPKELEAYDKVKLGDSEFIFFPACGEAFEWNKL